MAVPIIRSEAVGLTFFETTNTRFRIGNCRGAEESRGSHFSAVFIFHSYAGRNA